MVEKGKLGYQIGLVAFLLMIIIGFTLPGILDNPNDLVIPQPRICQHDADCYLLCDDIPLTVLCSQNLCQQNACEEVTVYPYQAAPTTFSLRIEVDSNRVNFANRTSSSDLFVAFSADTVQMFSSLTLGMVLEKAGLGLLGSCLTVDSTPYCSNEQKELTMMVKGEQSYQYEQYVPTEGDEITIKYS